MSPDPSAPADSDVLVLGGGFAGTWCARRLERALLRGAKIRLVPADREVRCRPCPSLRR